VQTYTQCSESRPRVTCTEFREDLVVVPERYARGQSNRRTDRHAGHDTPPLSSHTCGRSKDVPAPAHIHVSAGRYNWHSAGSLGCWPFPTLKCKYIFQTKYTEAILSISTRKLSRFEITKMVIAVTKNRSIVLFIIILGTFSFPIV